MRGTWFLAVAVGVAACGGPAAAAEAAKPARMLVVSVTTGFRHASIGTAEPALDELGRATGLFHCDHLRMPPGRLPQPKAPKRAKDTSDEAWAKQEAEFKAQQETFRRDDQAWQAGLKAEFAKVFSAESPRSFMYSQRATTSAGG